MDRLLTRVELTVISLNVMKEALVNPSSKEETDLLFYQKICGAQEAKTLKAVGEWLSQQMSLWGYSPDNTYNDAKMEGWLDHEYRVRQLLLYLRKGEMPKEVKNDHC